MNKSDRALCDIEILDTNGPLAELQPILKRWQSNVLQYAKSHNNGEDVCWRYTERADISVLAAAAWKTPGWIALEEYSTIKRASDGNKKDGRCDLYISNPESSSFAFEAKHAWQPIGKKAHRLKNSRIISKLSEAVHDAKKLRKGEADIKIAACFVVPLIPREQQSEEEVSALIRNWIEDGVRADETMSEWDAAAWIFPKETRLFWPGRNYMPGVVLLLKVVSP